MRELSIFFRMSPSTGETTWSQIYRNPETTYEAPQSVPWGPDHDLFEADQALGLYAHYTQVEYKEYRDPLSHEMRAVYEFVDTAKPSPIRVIGIVDAETLKMVMY